MASLTTAPPQLDLEVQIPKMLTSKEELALMRDAYTRDKQSPVILDRLLAMLVKLDHFEEAISLLDVNEVKSFRRLRFLYTSLWSREDESSNQKAAEVAERAINASERDKDRAQALADLSKLELRLERYSSAEKHLVQALQTDATNKDAYKRLARFYMDRDPEKALVFAKETEKSGIRHARVLGSIPMILAKLGRFDEAHEAESFARFHVARQPEAPSGWSSLKEFNDALAAEILEHPDMRYERYGTASTKTWRVDDPLLRRSRIFPHLQQMVRSEIVKYAANLEDENHPLALARPSRAEIQNWCVVTQGEGHESWHVHQGGWVSGVYYIHVQDHITNGTGKDGCISFGMSDEFVGAETSAEYGETVIRPHTGLFMIFPSHSFHRTYPHYGPGHRICFAFDVVPVDAE